MKKIIVTGNAGRDAESKSDQNGNNFATFSVAISVGTKQAPRTDWVEVSCNGNQADFACKYIRKGTKLLIEGFPTTSAYINIKDNKPVATLRIYANNIEILSRKDDNADQAPIGQGTNRGANANTDDDVYVLPEDDEINVKSDDVPF